VKSRRLVEPATLTGPPQLAGIWATDLARPKREEDEDVDEAEDVEDVVEEAQEELGEPP
jgi:hypothetical protein